jgi:EAL domain-containing protein (putative c-di-GMP-specific phosphodiesterase class I)/CheY-like chemotaxis protein
MPGTRRTRERLIREELRAGIRRGELLPHYQPIVSVRQRELQRLEVLARWDHPDLGLLDAPEFIKVAERHGLMPALTDALLERAVADLRAWRSERPGLRLSLNISALTLRDPHLPDEMGRRLATLGASPDWLAVEITEGVLMTDPGRARENIAGLKRLGARVEIDDFGTGYSSLRYLQLLPVDAVKIDRQFVTDAFRDRQSEVIVRTVIGMCHELGFEAIAEGVESPEVWGLVKALGCDAAQGYLISPPLGASALSEWLSALPYSRAAFDAVGRTPDGGSHKGPSHILVVDDEPAILSLVKDVLVDHGYRVETAANGQEALTAMTRSRPGLVLVDVHMPVLDGEGLVNEMRARGLNAPVVVLTAGPSADLWARRLGVEGAVQKPFRIPDLINAATRFVIPADGGHGSNGV